MMLAGAVVVGLNVIGTEHRNRLGIPFRTKGWPTPFYIEYDGKFEQPVWTPVFLIIDLVAFVGVVLLVGFVSEKVFGKNYGAKSGGSRVV